LVYFTMLVGAAGRALEYNRLDPGALLQTVIESFGGDEAPKLIDNLTQSPLEPLTVAATSGGGQGASRKRHRAAVHLIFAASY
jgi:hypothetical protein